MFRRILSELLEAASERSGTEPVELFNLEPVTGRPRNPEPIHDEIGAGSREDEDAAGHERRLARARSPLSTATMTQREEVPRKEIRAVLRSRGGIGRALIIAEILGQPRSLRGWDELR